MKKRSGHKLIKKIMKEEKTKHTERYSGSFESTRELLSHKQHSLEVYEKIGLTESQEKP